MATLAENDQLAAAKAQELIADIPLMPGITSIRVEPYIDNTGDPSLQLTFSHSGEIPRDDRFLDEFRDFSGKIQTRILHSDLNRFPYVRLEQTA